MALRFLIEPCNSNYNSKSNIGIKIQTSLGIRNLRVEFDVLNLNSNVSLAPSYRHNIKIQFFSISKDL